MTTDDALAVLKVARPQIRATDQTDADERLKRWKADVLRPAFKAAAHAAHPDRGGSDAAMRKVLAARDQLDGLAIQMRQPRPPTVNATTGYFIHIDLDKLTVDAMRAMMQAAMEQAAAANDAASAQAIRAQWDRVRDLRAVRAAQDAADTAQMGFAGWKPAE